MITRMSSSFGLALVAVAMASAAEPVTRVTDYDTVHIRVLDPDKAASWYVGALGAKLSEPPAPGTAGVRASAAIVIATVRLEVHFRSQSTFFQSG